MSFLCCSLFSSGLCFIEIFLLFLTMIRVPFLYKIIRKKISSKKVSTITFKKCVQIAFVEMIKDFPFIPIISLLIVLAPWRLKKTLQVFFSQQKRVPNIEFKTKKIYIPGKRKDVLFIFWQVFTYDYVNIIKGAVLLLSLYKIKKVLEIFKICYLKIKNDFRFSEFDLQKELNQEITNLNEDFKAVIYLFLILVIGFRVKFCYRRLNVSFFLLLLNVL